MKDIPHYYHDLSPEYDHQRANRYFRMIEDIEYGILQQYIALIHEPAVLEVGCGTGIFLTRIRSRVASLHGLDRTRAMLDIAQQKMARSQVMLVHGDAIALPYRDSSFDLIYSYKVLAHVPHLERALAEIRRLLRPQGVAILEFYNSHSIRRLAYRGGYFHQWHTPAEIHRLVEASGLQIERVCGARIVTPFAQAVEVPLIRMLLTKLERALSTSFLNRFAGYYIVACRLK